MALARGAGRKPYKCWLIGVCDRSCGRKIRRAEASARFAREFPSGTGFSPPMLFSVLASQFYENSCRSSEAPVFGRRDHAFTMRWSRLSCPDADLPKLLSLIGPGLSGDLIELDES